MENDTEKSMLGVRGDRWKWRRKAKTGIRRNNKYSSL